jgi:hypothetical protein|tara:strand:- start:1719 stop:1871 length:153 start_codon:yes stop_codon:yes gene_type:complete
MESRYEAAASLAEFGDKVAGSEAFQFLQAAFSDAATPISSIQSEPLYYIS